MIRYDLIVVGAGAKAAGIATKVHILNSLGLAQLSLLVIEGTEVAASWKGRNGMTSGEEPLAVTPIKDVGFPYQSHVEFGEAGEAIDAALAQFTWQQHMISTRRYARWVDAGSPQVRHRDYGEYLTWVLSRATEGVAHLCARVTQVTLDEEGERWLVEVEEAAGRARHAGGALVLTGPGIHRAFPARAGRRRAGLPLRQQARRVRPHPARTRVRHRDRRRRRERPQRDDVPARHAAALPLHDLHADAADEPRRELPREPRLLQPRHGRMGARSTSRPGATSSSTPTAASSTRRAWQRSPTTTAAASSPAASPMSARPPGRGVRLDYEAPEGTVSREHDYVANCTGFDLLAQLRTLFPATVREEIERQVGPIWDQPAGSEVPIGRNLELEGMHPRLQIPGLAGLSQGPGFANLGALGLLSNRVLQPFLLDEVAEVGAACGRAE